MKGLGFYFFDVLTRGLLGCGWSGNALGVVLQLCINVVLAHNWVFERLVSD